MPRFARRGTGAAIALALAALVLAVGGRPAEAAAPCPWVSRALSPQARTSMLVSAMTLQDKLALVTGVDPHEALGVADGPLYVGYVPGNPALCIPALALNDGPAGVADTQVGTTSFPAPIAQAATWSTSLQEKLGAALGLEAWQKGVNVLLAPDVNIARVPENGRNFEAFGEDPFLSGRTAVAEIDGIQQNPVIATVKHFAVNSQETNRYSVSSNLDERTLQEIYLPPFTAAVADARVGAVMCAYGLLNAAYDCQDGPLLTQVLRDQLGFHGLVMSDWNATRSTIESANDGLDLEMPGGTFFGSALADAVASGAVSMQTVDGMARDILAPMFRLGLFDDPAPTLSSVASTDVSTPTHLELAVAVAEQGTVLLKNDADALPLSLHPGDRLAVIGAPAAGDIRPYLGGGGSSYVTTAPAAPVTPVDALAAQAAKAGATVVSADGSDPAAAAALAATSTVAVVFAYDVEREGEDRTTLALPAAQDDLIAQVAAANPHTIVVLDTGGPVLMPWLAQVPAVVEAWYPGEEDGTAIAAILFGLVDPSGRLPQTFPAGDEQVPAASPDRWPGSGGAQDASFGEGIDVGYRWYDALKVAPLFPFGFGLSYTTFAYSRLRIERDGEHATVTFTVTNTGSRPGSDVAQLYVDDPAAAQEPPKQLAGYAKVFLRPGRGRRITLTVDPRSLSYWSSATRTWTAAPGLYRILVGESSRDIRLRGFVRLPAR